MNVKICQTTTPVQDTYIEHGKKIANHEWDLLPSYNYSKYLSTYLVKRDRQHIL